MNLIPSRDAVNFLAQVAPRPWVQRLLRWSAFDEGLTAYTRKGRVQAFGHVVQFTAQLMDKAGQSSGPRMDATIREEYSEEIAAKLIGKDPYSNFDDEPFIWSETEDPIPIDIGFFLYASEINWDAGVLTAYELPGFGDLQEAFFPRSVFLQSSLEMPQFEAKLEGLSFVFAEIEMLLPSMELSQSIGFTAAKHERGNYVGRPQKWDWEGAMAHMITHAQHPDGLPSGPGAQARIEELISEWFMQAAQEAPSSSQIRLRASKIMQMIEIPKMN